MDYLPTLGETMLHARGKLGKYAHPMEHLGIHMPKIIGGRVTSFGPQKPRKSEGFFRSEKIHGGYSYYNP